MGQPGCNSYTPHRGRGRTTCTTARRRSFARAPAEEEEYKRDLRKKKFNIQTKKENERTFSHLQEPGVALLGVGLEPGARRVRVRADDDEAVAGRVLGAYTERGHRRHVAREEVLAARLELPFVALVYLLLFVLVFCNDVETSGWKLRGGG